VAKKRFKRIKNARAAPAPQPAAALSDAGPVAPIHADQKHLRAFIERRHPEYLEMVDHWNFLEATYKGGRDWFKEVVSDSAGRTNAMVGTGNIFRYIKEGEKEYKDRLTRCYRFNHTREVTDLVQKYIFKSPIIRNEDNAPEVIKAFWAKATLAGLNIDQFMKLASTSSSIFGRPWIFTDTNAHDDGPISVADEKETGVQAYAYIVKPQDILDIGFSEGGEVEWIFIREWIRDDADPITSSGDVTPQYRLWTETEWHLFETKVDPRTKTLTVIEINQGVNPIGRVPGFPLDHVVGDNRYSAPALISDIAYLDRAIANYLSNLDAIIQDQTFSQLAMPAQALTPGTDEYKALVELGTKRIFIYDGEGGAKPEYLSPDPKQAGMIVGVINKIINEIYHTIGMAGERTKSDNNVGIDNSSGVAKAYDFERMNSLLTSKADSLENGENKLIELVMLWNSGVAPDQSLVKYPDTFDVRSLFDEFTLAERLAIVDAPPSIRREQMKQVIDKLFPRLAEELRKTMETDLESWPLQLDAIVTAKFGSGQTSTFPATASKTSGGSPGPATTKPAASNRQGQVTKTTPA
jgi:hypothetical protein